MNKDDLEGIAEGSHRRNWRPLKWALAGSLLLGSSIFSYDYVGQQRMKQRTASVNTEISLVDPATIFSPDNRAGPVGTVLYQDLAVVLYTDDKRPYQCAVSSFGRTNVAEGVPSPRFKLDIIFDEMRANDPELKRTNIRAYVFGGVRKDFDLLVSDLRQGGINVGYNYCDDTPIDLRDPSKNRKEVYVFPLNRQLIFKGENRYESFNLD